MRGGCLGRLRRAERRIVGVPGGAVTIERVGVGLVPLSQKMSQKVAGAAVRESGSGAIPK